MRLRSTAVASTIVEVAADHGLDLLHVHYAVPHATSAYLARQVLGKRAPRVVTTLHGTDVTRVGVDPGYQSITRFAVAASDGLTVPSEFLRGEARRFLGRAETAPIAVIPNFVDTEHFIPPVRRDRAGGWFGEKVPTARVLLGRRSPAGSRGGPTAES